MAALLVLQDTIEIVLGAIDNRDKALGNVREIIDKMRASNKAFELIVNEALMHYLLEFKPTKT